MDRVVAWWFLFFAVFVAAASDRAELLWGVSSILVAGAVGLWTAMVVPRIRIQVYPSMVGVESIWRRERKAFMTSELERIVLIRPRPELLGARTNVVGYSNKALVELYLGGGEVLCVATRNPEGFLSSLGGYTSVQVEQPPPGFALPSMDVRPAQAEGAQREPGYLIRPPVGPVLGVVAYFSIMLLVFWGLDGFGKFNQGELYLVPGVLLLPMSFMLYVRYSKTIQIGSDSLRWRTSRLEYREIRFDEIEYLWGHGRVALELNFRTRPPRPTQLTLNLFGFTPAQSERVLEEIVRRRPDLRAQAAAAELLLGRDSRGWIPMPPPAQK